MSFASFVRVVKGTEEKKIERNEIAKSFVDEEKMSPEALASEFLKFSTYEEKHEIGVPRASSLHKTCIRQNVLGYLENAIDIRRGGGVKAGMAFGIGNALHFWVQNTDELFVRKRRIGWWRCLSCNHLSAFGPPPEQNCQFCGANRRAFIYYEHPFKLTSPYMCTGHPDMFLKHPYLDSIHITEFKTMAGEQFGALRSPLIDHVWQVMTYMDMAQHDPNIPISVSDEWGYIFYFAKKVGKDQFPLKAFRIKKNLQVWERIKTKLELFTAGIQVGGVIPDRHPTCVDNPRCYRARTCPVRSRCLSFSEVV